MEKDRTLTPGQIYQHFKDKPYQIITLATHSETREEMVVYQALYGDFKTYIRSVTSFLSEVDHVKYPQVSQKYRFELRTVKDRTEPNTLEMTNTKPDEQMENIVKEDKIKEDKSKEDIVKRENIKTEVKHSTTSMNVDITAEILEKETPILVVAEGMVNAILMQFLDAESYYKKLEVITSNKKHLNDRLINDMAVSLDCAVDEGPLEQRIQDLIYCLQAMSRFEDKRLR